MKDQPTERARHAVLVIEDDLDIQDGMATLLRLRGYEVATASDGAEALALLADGDGQRRPGLILLDLMMPGMNGWEFRNRQLADPALAEIPVVIFTGLAEPDDALAELRPDATLGKPFSSSTLLELVRRFCG